jgi:acyl CoA:acetate/3-ketoacid CoA transferase beta subunit
VLDVTKEGLKVLELSPGETPDSLQAATEARLIFR